MSERRDIDELKNLLYDIVRRLESLEKKLEEREIDDEAELLYMVIKLLQLGVGTVDIASAARRFVSLRRKLTASSLRDSISRTILEILAVKGPLDISSLTAELRRQRGKASRRIVAQRVSELERRGFVKTERKGRRRVVKLVE